MVVNDAKARREAKGMTQREVAEKAGCTEKTIRKVEAGKGVILSIGRAIEKALK